MEQEQKKKQINDLCFLISTEFSMILNGKQKRNGTFFF